MWTNKKKPEILSLLTTPPLCKLGIQNFLDTPVKNMSGGMKKRLSLACALLEHPQILLMDEPFAALDLPAKQDALQFMQYYLGLGNSILIASHEEAVFQFCSHVYLLQNGTLQMHLRCRREPAILIYYEDNEGKLCLDLQSLLITSVQT